MRDLKSKLKIAEIAKRITGFSTPFGGMSWKAPADERDEVRALLSFLEDRRVLYNPMYLEIESQVSQSVIEIRRRCTEALGKLSNDSAGTAHVRAIRAACRRFLDLPKPQFKNVRHRTRDEFSPDFFASLGELRATVGAQIGALAVQYDVEIEQDLASILPIEDKD